MLARQNHPVYSLYINLRAVNTHALTFDFFSSLSQLKNAFDKTFDDENEAKKSLKRKS